MNIIGIVGNHVSETRQLTEITQWKFIAGKHNPADVISRGQNKDSWDIDEWVRGPKFLWKYKNEWNVVEVDGTLSDNDTEMKWIKDGKLCFLKRYDLSLLLKIGRKDAE